MLQALGKIVQEEWKGVQVCEKVILIVLKLDA